jgi:aminoglycoside phosphotransferase family enzyme/cytidylate kinase
VSDTVSTPEQSLQNDTVVDQADIIDFLADPSAYGGGVANVERIDTHASVVFLAGARAFKLKRAVRYPFLDYSTLELRRDFCEREVAINRRTAPALYEGVVPVVLRQDGGLALGGTGTAVDYLVAMRRFDDAGLFSQLAETGGLDVDLIVQAVDEVIALHGGAEVVQAGEPSGGGAAGLYGTIANNAAELTAYSDLFGADPVADYTAAAEDAFARATDLLDRRAATGFVRHCHGDLHLANICLFEGRPTLFDAIEFSEAFACIDTLYDFAFLLMDLDVRGLDSPANRAFNRYMARNSEGAASIAGVAALPLFMSVRAAIRAIVSALTAAKLDHSAAIAARDTARDYFSAARRYLEPSRPRLMAIGGASGTGKSAVALALAPEISGSPGALVLRTDEIRKQLAGLRDDETLPPSAYTAERHAAVYQEMQARAAASLAAGRSCILDAVHGRPDERLQARQVAERHGAAFTGIWLEAPEERLFERVTSRQNDPSDAGAEVVRRQLAAGFGAIDWLRVDADQPLDRVVGAARKFMATHMTD